MRSEGKKVFSFKKGGSLFNSGGEGGGGGGYESVILVTIFL